MSTLSKRHLLPESARLGLVPKDRLSQDEQQEQDLDRLENESFNQPQLSAPSLDWNDDGDGRK